MAQIVSEFESLARWRDVLPYLNRRVIETSADDVRPVGSEEVLDTLSRRPEAVALRRLREGVPPPIARDPTRWWPRWVRGSTLQANAAFGPATDGDRVEDLSESDDAIETEDDERIYALTCTVLDGRPVVVGGSLDGAVDVIDLRTGATIMLLEGPEHGVIDVSCADVDGMSAVVACSPYEPVSVWNLGSGNELPALTMPLDDALFISFAEVGDRPIVVSGRWDYTVGVHDLAGRTGPVFMVGHTARIRGLTCMRVDGRPVAVTVSEDGTGRVWDLGAGGEIGVLTGHTGAVSAVADIEIDGRPVVVTGGVDRTVRVWSFDTCIQSTMLGGSDDWVRALECAVIDGRAVAISADDKTIRAWDLLSGARIANIALPHQVNAIAVSVDGTLVIASGPEVLCIDPPDVLR